jgi:two-component system, NtrC family, sensor histidine kinase PilS
VLVFLEDTSLVADRAQQSKLASLGRLSASIAHEIRNPVGAMSHASQLLREAPSLTEDDRHLTDIIEKNATRVSQIIENVLQLSRRDTTRQERLSVADWLTSFVTEYEQTVQLDPAAFRVEIQPDAAPLEVQFDPSHLHQVVWNLCDNALRHGSATGASTGASAGFGASTGGASTDASTGASADASASASTGASTGASAGAGARVELRAGRIAASDRPFLEISDRGPGIDPTHAERIFEPFFTNGAGGTGLGLFISRELCQTNGALLLYEARPGGGSIFRIIFADPKRWAW